MKEFYSRADVSGYTYGYANQADERIGWGIIPKYSFNGSSSSYLSDYLWVKTGTRVACVGGYWANGLLAGLSALYLGSVPSDSGRSIGARLAKF